MQTNGSAPAASGRMSTIAAHYKAVERVILEMRKRLGDPLTLEEMAEIAIISPYHFDRVFSHLIGIPPCQFLGTLRMEAAKRLLLTTSKSVTEVCFEVGYNSLGTFITRFTQLVGMAPRRLRRLADDTDSSQFRSALDYPADLIEDVAGRSAKAGAAIAGEVGAQGYLDGLIFVGLFPTPIPQSRPVGCTLMTAPGRFHIPDVPDGHYYVMAAAIPWTEDPLAYLLTDRSALGVAVARGPVFARRGRISDKVELELRPPRLTDPPILIVLPLLFNEFFADTKISAHISDGGRSYAA